MINTSYFAHKDVRIPNIDERSDYFKKIYLNDKITDCLRLVLGAALTSLLEAQTNSNWDLLPTATQKWKSLIEGETYDGKVWKGFTDKRNKRSFLAYYVKEQWCFDDESGTFGTGEQTSKVENSHTDNNERRRIFAHNKFVEWVAGIGCNDEVSLYQYLHDKKDDFPEWKGSNFELTNAWNV